MLAQATCTQAPTWAQARQLAYQCARPLPSTAVTLREAIGGTLTSPVTARQDLPHYASSAMDGWAVNSTGNSTAHGICTGPWLMTASGLPLAPGQASVIATGGLVPSGATAILRKESGCVSADGSLTLKHDAKPHETMPGRHIRPAGEEAAAGDVLIPAGTLLNPAHIALASVAGHDHVQIQRKPRVAVVLTGSEVVTSGEPAPGQVRDAFGPQLDTVISQLGGEPCGQLRIGDSYDQWLAALGGVEGSVPDADLPDVTVTTGGTGKSGTDHFRDAVAALGGRLLLDGIAMRPGHPAVLAELPDGRFIIGLPGNPLAAIMALMTLGEPLLAALADRPLTEASLMTSGADMEPDPRRTRLVPCTVIHDLVFPASHTGPGMMRGLAWANGYMAVPPEGVAAGSPVPVLPLPWT
ncbi:molybdopterin molybdotransferase MoeA [Paenarthrobacter aurescens]|uniref:Molybdopterin molybdenumtransferase n=1 Tax=Paenarthrobacter aurescens TaxID=43663 RepID=A0A4Y3NP00_PAEAU|nr:molybdopterin molybdotransferase MoeA [Paenarthrobacter aurescens]MDO6145270.1 molybdopterin molybdotransferase MoeA [Paenarthrobacter aurescens]MDO6145961.1 molybdopterin molybdotransferase MoeA [Paenarthrobacter aurescens]MDO6157205.1 molybdopterin molybdotransferase MoeA [Paenarthrobacter aurescens]MDO6161190.1 molybdopterin molybdotransferase MoeA [Paenarthrobacter aurescens]GEB20906.1 molybdopterin molybdenumtransferase MoeA [Paenarthrobacter aurescens]